MHDLVPQITGGSFKALARAISLVENEAEGYMDILKSLSPLSSPVIGITGPPGAGKSTLVDALIRKLVSQSLSIGVLCIDPSSPFNLGALLGDRIRMSEWYNYPNVFIRSLATRGSLGGLHPSIISITSVMKAFGFDYIIVETVGVGQSEVEIAGIADTTIVVLVPEAGDEVQTMKAGLMEIADIFVINKADRPGADIFEKNLRYMLTPHRNVHLPVIKTIASQQKGVEELLQEIQVHNKSGKNREKQTWLFTEKAWQLLAAKRMSDLNKQDIFNRIQSRLESGITFNLYQFIEEFC